MNILICTIIRDRGRALKTWRNQLEGVVAGRPDDTFDLAVYENDSNDGSTEILQQLDFGYFKNTFIKSDTLGTRYFGSTMEPGRTEPLADARNRCMNLPPTLDVYDVIIWVEPDIRYEAKDVLPVINSLVEEDLDACSPYSWAAGPGQLYDTWATRPLHPYLQHPYPKGLIPVLSTWNCFCVYKAEPFKKGLRFIGGDCDTAQICVGLRCLGHDKIFINASHWIQHVNFLEDFPL